MNAPRMLVRVLGSAHRTAFMNSSRHGLVVLLENSWRGLGPRSRDRPTAKFALDTRMRLDGPTFLFWVIIRNEYASYPVLREPKRTRAPEIYVVGFALGRWMELPLDPARRPLMHGQRQHRGWLGERAGDPSPLARF